MEVETTDNSTPSGGSQPDIKVLLLDTPENEGVDFLQSLNKEGMKFDLERVSGRDDLFKALKDGTWDILLVNDQVTEPGLDETLSFLEQVKSDAGYVLLSKEALTIESLANSYKEKISEVVSSLHLAYSLEVFSRAAEKSRRNFQLSQLNQQKFELARHRDQLMSGTEEALAYLQDGIHVFGNNAYLNMLGYKDMEELAYMPFIDVVSTEMRDKVKQQLLDYQHKVRVKPETEALELSELFLTSIGDKEGILDVEATLQPVSYDGEECLQIVIKDKSAMTGKGDGAGEGLGYPLFIAHLDNFIAEAKSSGGTTGQVVHVTGNGFEHYIASKGFGSLNGKMKALASELKARLSSNDLAIRFTENSFLILIKGNEAEDAEKVTQIAEVLQKFQAALNKEIGNAKGETLVLFNHDVVPVTNESESADQLIKPFLLGAKADEAEKPDKTDEPVAEKAVEEKKAEKKAEKKEEVVEKKEAVPEKKETAVEKKEAVPENKEAAVEKKEAVQEKKQKKTQPAETRPEDTASASPVKEKAAPSESAESPEPEAAAKQQRAAEQTYDMTPDGIESALNDGALALYYEPIISVTSIETEYYDLSIIFKDDGRKLDSSTFGKDLIDSPVSAKLDTWALKQALLVVSELHKQRKDCRVLVPLTARTLTDEKHVVALCKDISSFSLPENVITLDFKIKDLMGDLEVILPQLNKFKDIDVGICASGVRSLGELLEFQDENFLNLVRLEGSMVGKAQNDEDAHDTLDAMIEIMHSNRIKVAAININDSNLLAVCCKAQLDLVTGEHIQKKPLPMSVESLTEAMNA